MGNNNTQKEKERLKQSTKKERGKKRMAWKKKTKFNCIYCEIETFFINTYIYVTQKPHIHFIAFFCWKWLCFKCIVFVI